MYSGEVVYSAYSKALLYPIFSVVFWPIPHFPTLLGLSSYFGESVGIYLPLIVTFSLSFLHIPGSRSGLVILRRHSILSPARFFSISNVFKSPVTVLSLVIFWLPSGSFNCLIFLDYFQLISY